MKEGDRVTATGGEQGVVEREKGDGEREEHSKRIGERTHLANDFKAVVSLNGAVQEPVVLFTLQK